MEYEFSGDLVFSNHEERCYLLDEQGIQENNLSNPRNKLKLQEEQQSMSSLV